MVFHIIYVSLYLLSILGQLPASDLHYRLYNSDRININDLQYDCLLLNEDYLHQGFYTEIYASLTQQIIPFCIRSFDLASDTLINNQIDITDGIPITFENLRSQNLISEDLYLLSIPIDIVERYQEYLETLNNSLSKEVIYNCTSPWFGEFCQYTFNSTLLFNTIVKNYFKNELDSLLLSSVAVSCFIFLKCDRGPSPLCLDWREICDGKIDCFDGGHDEIGCEDLETVECTNDEFLCGNGFCIPNDFFDDDMINPDCIDRSDEKDTDQSGSYLANCPEDPAFRCEEITCRNEHEAICGTLGCRILDCSPLEVVLRQAQMSWNENYNISFDCWTSLICLTKPGFFRGVFDDVKCPIKNESIVLFQQGCPLVFSFPPEPILLGHVRFVYGRNLIGDKLPYRFLLPYYVCYDEQLCEFLPATVSINGLSCRRLSEINLEQYPFAWIMFERSMINVFRKCLSKHNNYVQCPKTKPFRCTNSSKCLALNRVLDGFEDCFQGDDENINNSASLPDKRYRFRCLTQDKYVSIVMTTAKKAGCPGLNDNDGPLETRISNELNYPLVFSSLCNGYIQYSMLDRVNDTDEMDCSYWLCNNTYTRCDDLGIWHCLNGADEVDCPRNPCRPNGHPCILLDSYNITCLPLYRFNDGIIDCLGAYDERAYCRQNWIGSLLESYRCSNSTKCVYSEFDDNHSLCDWNEDQILLYENFPTETFWCHNFSTSPSTQTLNLYSYLCSLSADFRERHLMYFTLRNHMNYPTINEKWISPTMMETVSVSVPSFDSSIQTIRLQSNIFCHRGIPVYSNDLRRTYCLCSPAYFGDQCQYQSERVSVTLQFRTAELRTPFTFVIMLIDNYTNIHSYEHIDYLSVRDCRKKFNVYLLYSTRPKLLNYTYYIRIDTYNKMKMEYYVSLFYPIRFPFLPVHRLSFQVDIPLQEGLIVPKKCPLKCLHGQCTQFINLEQFFCRCFDGYSGTLCSVVNECNCSPDSICVDTSHKRSICVCPRDKFGPRCYLNMTACRPNSCHNESSCIGTDVRISESEYFCVCPKGSMGSKCDKTEMKIEFHFDQNILIPQLMTIHFIFVPSSSELGTRKYWNYSEPSQTSQISKIGYSQNSAIIYYANPFSLIFVEFNQDYYLAVLQHNYTAVTNLSTNIIPEHRCKPIDQLLNQQIQSLPTWHRAKYYHIPCQNQSDLTCFYDNDYFMCLCDLDRHANCFKFDFKRIYNCFGYNYCQNDGQCYQDHKTCPTASSCFCKECYFGSLCQFTSTGFGLSLDDILSYNIYPSIPFSQQSIEVKISTSVTILLFVAAIINTFLSIITFRTKKSLDVGCGLYLLTSSITSGLTMIMFTLKFFLLVFSQILIITNHSFLLVNCIIMNMLLKSLLAINDWIYACVAVERTMVIYTGVKFNKTKSKKYAKGIIITIYLITFLSHIHDPIHRQLLNDNEEERTWCVVRYSSSIQDYAMFINIIHFFLPFGINIISVLTMIILLARQKSETNQRQTYREHLWMQFKVHKHCLFSSLILILIAMPRLMISFLSTCMKSTRKPGLYLAGYFISFIPPLLGFIIFVLPSKFYKKEFTNAILATKKNIQRRFRHE